MTLRDAELAVPVPATRSAAPLALETARLEALSLRAHRALQRAIALRAQAQAIMAMRTQVSSQELLAVSPLARLHARAATMPVIEQAKGILMAQQGCGEDEAFDLLRRASQRSNVPVRELAERIIQTLPRRRGPSRGTNGQRPR